MMDAISLWQPWASLIAIGAKPYETRDWPPPRRLIGQRIAIHAAKKVDRDGVDLAMDCAAGERGQELADKLHESVSGIPDSLLGKFGFARLPVGCIICTVTLEAAFQLGNEADGTALPAAEVGRVMASRQFPPCFTVRYDPFGNYAPGRWAWLLSDAQVLRVPVPTIGRQKMFSVELAA